MQLGDEHLFYCVLAALAGAGIIVCLRWVMSGLPKADPWGEEIARDIESPESAPVCHHCFTEHSDHAHFCLQCGAAVGDFNNVLPYEYLFSEGEVLRNGTMSKVPRSLPVMAGYLLFSLGAYSIFAPVYWFCLFRNRFRQEADVAREMPGADE